MSRNSLKKLSKARPAPAKRSGSVKRRVKAQAKRAPAKDETLLELDGTVSLVERVNGKVTRSEIDGKTVLNCLLVVIMEGLDRMEAELVGEKPYKSKACWHVPTMVGMDEFGGFKL